MSNAIRTIVGAMGAFVICIAIMKGCDKAALLWDHIGAELKAAAEEEQRRNEPGQRTVDAIDATMKELGGAVDILSERMNKSQDPVQTTTSTTESDTALSRSASSQPETTQESGNEDRMSVTTTFKRTEAFATNEEECYSDEEFEQIKLGMTFGDVARIIGNGSFNEGILTRMTEDTVTREWYNQGHFVIYITFDKVTQRVQGKEETVFTVK